MIRFVIQIAVFFLFILLLRWFLKQVIVSKKNGPAGRTSTPGGNMVKDPMCGMYMDPRLAVVHKKNNGVFYFCSEECKNKFLKIDPGKSPGESPR
jgi:uncharacterized protein